MSSPAPVNTSIPPIQLPKTFKSATLPRNFQSTLPPSSLGNISPLTSMYYAASPSEPKRSGMAVAIEAAEKSITAGTLVVGIVVPLTVLQLQALAKGSLSNISRQELGTSIYHTMRRSGPFQAAAKSAQLGLIFANRELMMRALYSRDSVFALPESVQSNFQALNPSTQKSILGGASFLLGPAVLQQPIYFNINQRMSGAAAKSMPLAAYFTGTQPAMVRELLSIGGGFMFGQPVSAEIQSQFPQLNPLFSNVLAGSLVGSIGGTASQPFHNLALLQIQAREKLGHTVSYSTLIKEFSDKEGSAWKLATKNLSKRLAIVVLINVLYNTIGFNKSSGEIFEERKAALKSA